MKKFIIPLICYLCILCILLNIDKITTFLSDTVSNKEILTIEDGNEYTKDYDFAFIKNSKDYIPYSYNDLLDIIYSVINQGWEEFTFYCPSEYTECVSDISKITKDEYTLTHINNFVNPYNSFDYLKIAVSEYGEITVHVYYLYSKEEIKTINDYVNNLITELYDKDKDDYENLIKFHDYIINNTKYDIERNNNDTSQYKSYTAYGPVKDGYATCNGYADLMAIILDKLGYVNYKIATTKEEISYESNGHVWNAVKIDDKWLHLDLTWDDPVSEKEDNLYHKYFLITTEEMQEADTGNVNVEAHNFNRAIYQEFKDTNN